MSWPTTHAILNHFPIVLVIVGAIMLLAALVRPMRGAWLYALGSFILAAISVYPAWLTGEKAARFVHDAWYVAPGAVHRHAQTADITLWVVLALGLVSLIAWLSIVRTMNAISPAGWLRTLIGLLTIGALGCIGVTAYFGGKVVIESPILMKPMPPIAVPVPATGTTPAGPGALPSPTGTAPTTTSPVTTPGTAPATAPGGAIVPAQPSPTQPNATQPTQPAAQPTTQPARTTP